MIKKVVIRIVLATIILVVVGLVVVFFSLNSIVKKGVETVGPKLTKVDVRLGSASLSPFSGRGELNSLFVGNPEGYKTPSAIKVGDIRVGVKPSSVLSETLVVDEVRIEAPEITLEGSLSGNNLSKILDNIDAASAGDKTDKNASKSEKKFYVKDLLITGGKINLSISTPLGGKSATLALPEVHVQNIGSADKGATAAELAQQIMKPILASATKAAAEGLGKNLQGIGSGTTEELDKAAQGLKGLLKK